MANPGRLGFFRTTLVGGILFLIPLVVVVMILEKDVTMAQAVKCLHRLGRGSAALIRF
jgi:hypothetical protein